MRYKLGEVCETVSVTFRKPSKKVVLINTSDVLDGKVLNHEYTSNQNLRGQFKKSFKKNDILYSEIRPKNRRFAYVNFDAGDYVASTKLMVLRANDKVLPQFLFQILKSKEVIDQLQTLAETRSGTFPQITFSELAALEVHIPTLSTQKEIAETLFAFDAKIAADDAINHNLKALAQAIFKSWFVDFEPWGGIMPTDWREAELGDVTSLSAGGDKPVIYSATATDVCSVPVYSNGINNFGLYGYTDKPKITAESVTISARGTIGFVCLRQEPFVPIVRLVTAVPGDELSAEYLYLFLLNAHISGVGTTQQQLTVPNFKKYKVLVPNIKTMNDFTATVDSIFININHNHRESAHLAALRDTLLPKLLSGEVSVPHL